MDARTHKGGEMYSGERYTEGYKAIMSIVRMQDFDDPWGTALSNLFGLATVAYVEFDELLPEFQPGPVLAHAYDVGPVDLEDWPDAEYQELVRGDHVTLEDIEAAYAVINRYADLVPEDRRY